MLLACFSVLKQMFFQQAVKQLPDPGAAGVATAVVMPCLFPVKTRDPLWKFLISHELIKISHQHQHQQRSTMVVIQLHFFRSTLPQKRKSLLCLTVMVVAILRHRRLISRCAAQQAYCFNILTTSSSPLQSVGLMNFFLFHRFAST